MQTRKTLPNHFKKPSFWSILIDNFAIITAVVFVLLCLQIAASARAQTPELVRAGTLFLTSEAGKMQPALQLQTTVGMQIEGVSSRVSVQQTFTNHSNTRQDGEYVFPLPANSAVYAIRMLRGEREIISETYEEEQARETYSQMRDAGRKAALDQKNPDLFTRKLANIAPGETVTVELQYLQTAHYENGRFSLRFPMTVTPPYLHAQLQNTVSFDITLHAGMELLSLRSPSHTLDIMESLLEDDFFLITLQGGSAGMERDFELEWTPKSARLLQAATFTGRVE